MLSRNLFPLQTNGKNLTAAFCVSVVCFLIGLVAIAWPVIINGGFPLDDSWIHQVVGRNTALFGVPGFLPGIPSPGSTSTIWPWIIAFNYRVVSFVDPSIYLILVNSICLSVIQSVLFLSSVRDKLSTLEIILIAALPAITGNFVWLVASGMEHVFFVASVFLAAHFLFQKQSDAQPKSTLYSGISCALAILTRPEAIAFIPFFVVAARRLGRPRKHIFLFAFPCVISVALVLLNNYWTAYSLLPSTFSGRKWLYFENHSPHSFIWIVLLAKAWNMQILQFFLGLDIANLPKDEILLVDYLLCLSIPAGVFRLARLKAYSILFLLLLMVVNFGTYCLVFPTPGHAMRYQSMALVFVFPLLAMGLIEIGEHIIRAIKQTPQTILGYKAIATVVVGAVALTSLLHWNRITDANLKHVNGTHVEMGKWLAANLPSDTPVAVFDIGGIGYFSHMKTVDLGGLTNPDFQPYLFSHRVAEYLKEHDVQWIILPMNGDEEDACNFFRNHLGLCNQSGMSMEKVTSFFTPPKLWQEGMEATRNAFQGQVLYKIHWQ